jgi:hypothetical protein
MRLPVWLPLFLASRALALDCSTPPTNGFGSGYSAYAQWCSACGGSPSSSGGVSCKPGPNWGSQGGARGGGGGAAMAVPLLNEMIHHYFDWDDSEGKARRQAERERHERIREEREADEAAEKERIKARLSGELKLEGGKNALSLKKGDPAPRGGSLHVDCKDTRRRAEQLARGLGVQRDALRRTQAQIEAAKASKRASDEKAKELLRKKAYEKAQAFGSGLLTNSRALRVRIQAMKSAGVTPEKRRQWLETLDRLEEIPERWGNAEKVATAGQAGFAFGQEMQGGLTKVRERIAAANRLFVDSGLAEEIGGELAQYGFGPAGALGFEAATTAIDLTVALGEGAISEEEVRRAQDNYDSMRYQLSRNEDILRGLAEDLKSCKENS